MPADIKNRLLKYNQEQYTRFILSETESLTLLKPSGAPGLITAGNEDHYKKDHVSGTNVSFITKNDKPSSFIWQTSAKKIQEGVRWGIIKPESITGKVIAALGQYRIVAHERVAKGIISNTQTVKLALVDLYQKRFEALEKLESLVNKKNNKKKYENTFIPYISTLKNIIAELDGKLANIDPNLLNKNVLKQLKQDINSDIKRAESYSLQVTNDSLQANNRARGHESILEFVKQQMMHNLYELQGINQDITYSNKRFFALTRGVLNDFIEDARKEIDDNRADPRNAVTREHHGRFAKTPDEDVTYDFSVDKLSPYQERQVLLGISFIEEYDRVKDNKVNEQEPLSEIAATNWKTHRNAKTFFKSVGYFFLNTFKSAVDNTRPWEEESWSNKEFQLTAARLRQKATPNEPMWQKPLHFIEQAYTVFKDIFVGVKDVGVEIAFNLSGVLENDWDASKSLLSWEEVEKKASAELKQMDKVEQDGLDKIFTKCGYECPVLDTKNRQLAQKDYHLTPGEQNDVLTSMCRGVDGFLNAFAYNIHAKDPVAGLLFSGAYILGGAVIYAPAFMQSIFGANYVNVLTAAGYAFSSSKSGAAVAVAASQGPLASATADLLLHGPNSGIVNATSSFLEDPITYGTYVVAANFLGYFLVNGFGGKPIPWVSNFFSSELGTVKKASYIFVGGKMAIISYETFTTHQGMEYKVVKLQYGDQKSMEEGQAILDSFVMPHGLSPNTENLPKLGCETLDGDQKSMEKRQAILNRLVMAHWLSANTENLPKLGRETLLDIERHIDILFDFDEALSLKKLLYPERDKERSIAIQLLFIPLSYIPAILRFGVSIVLSGVAKLNGNPYPLQPLLRATDALALKTAKDLSRLLVFMSAVVQATFNLLTCNIKAVAFVLGMIAGRIAGLADLRIAHSIHKGFANVHTFFHTVGEFFYPAQTLKSVVEAHPAHTIKDTERSYKKMLGELLKVAGNKTAPDDLPPPVHEESLFKKDDGAGVGTIYSQEMSGQNAPWASS